MRPTLSGSTLRPVTTPLSTIIEYLNKISKNRGKRRGGGKGEQEEKGRGERRTMGERKG